MSEISDSCVEKENVGNWKKVGLCLYYIPAELN